MAKKVTNIELTLDDAEKLAQNEMSMLIDQVVKGDESSWSDYKSWGDLRFNLKKLKAQKYTHIKMRIFAFKG